MKTKTLLKKGIFLTCLLTLLVSFSNLAYVAAEEGRIIGNTEWKKSGNMVYTVLSGTGRVHKDSTHSFHYRFEEPIVVGSELDPQYMRVHIQGLDQYHGDAGAPVLPFKPVKIAIPEGEKVVGIRVEMGPGMQIPGQYLIEPTQRPVPISQMDKAKPTLPDSAIYNSDEAYPFVACGSVHLGKKGGIQIMDLNLFPAGYTSGGIVYYTDIRVYVDTIKDTGGITQFRPDQKVIDKVYTQVDNPDTLNTYITGADSADQCEYVIITTNALRDAQGEYTFQDLIAAKEQRGLTATIVTVEDDIYPNYDGTRPDGGADDQTKIRNFIIDYYQNHGTEYVLLAGDKDNIPPRFFRVDGTTMPVDMYYGCLDGTFDNDADGVYGEPTDGENGTDVDLYAEVFIGRAPVANADEVSNFVKKTLTYEQSSSLYLCFVYMVGEHLGFGGVSEYAKDSLEEIRLGSDAHGYTTVGFENSAIDSFVTYGLYDKDKTWSPNELISIMNSGVHILNHLGHAGYTYDMKLHTSALSSLTNDEYFFAYSQGCMPGGFDQNECFAEVITTMNEGAFAVVMNARYGWGRFNSTAGPSQYYDREFWDALLGEGIANLGRMNQDSKEDNISRINSACMRWCYYELNLFGDPELAVQCGGSFGVSITSPSKDSFIRTDVNIIGSAYAEEAFERYELYFASKNNPEDITLITSSTVPVEEGLLGVWDTDKRDDANMPVVPDGEYILTLKLIDTEGREAETSIEVTVDNYNQPPVFDITDKVVVIGRLLECKIATDPDDPDTPWGKLEVKAESLPPHAQFDPETRTFSWKPTESDKGIYEVTFTASDSEYQITQTITLTTLYLEEKRITNIRGWGSSPGHPAIFGDRVVWEGWRDGCWDIYMYDFSTGEETRITDGPSGKYHPDIYQDKIVWSDNRNGYQNLDIYMYDLSTKEETQITTDTSNQCYPSIYQDKITWDDGRNKSTDIYMYDFSTEEETQITTDPHWQARSVIYKDKIVWQDDRNGGDTDAYMYDLSTGEETRITSGPGYKYHFSIYEDKIIWTNWDNPNPDIYMYDLSTEKETQVTTDPTRQYFPAIFRDKIVWTDERNGSRDIYMYDISRGAEIQITTDSEYQVDPAIFGNLIVWKVNSMARFFYPPQIASISSTNPQIDEPLTITGRDFGYLKGDSEVVFANGVFAPIESWSDTKIVCTVPKSAASGLLKVVTKGGESNCIDIIVGTPPQMLYLRKLYTHNQGSSSLWAFYWLGKDKEDRYRINYSYRVDRGGWSKPSSATHIRYSRIAQGLEPGDHIFEVKAIDQNLTESTNIKGIRFTIKGNTPPRVLYLYHLKTFWGSYFFWLGYDKEDGYRLNYSYSIDEGEWSNPSRRCWIFTNDNDIKDFSVKSIDSKGLESDVRTIILRR